MRALVFDLSVPRYALAKALGSRVPGLYWGPGTCFGLRDDVAAPARPARDFAALAPRLTGFCGSDLAAILLKGSPALSAFASFPAVFGHEVLADVVEAPAGMADLREGDRVVVDPFLSCAARSAPDCARCARGEYATCERAGTGPRKGIMIGASRELPGGFAERMVAHGSQVFRVPEGMTDARAVLTEPLAVGVHAVLRHAPAGAERVLVIGGGMIAFAVLWALGELYPQAHATALALEDYQLAVARGLGARAALRPRTGEDTVVTLGLETGATILRPVLGRPFLAGGYDRVYDCVGTERSLGDALRVTRAGGTVVLLGNAGELPRVDWTFVWSKELTVAGTLAYGWDVRGGERRRSFAITLELLTSSRAPVESLVTHTFALEDYGAAIEANVDRRGTRSVKTVFRPQAHTRTDPAQGRS